MPSPSGYTTVTSSQLKDATGTLIANAYILFQPVANDGTPVSVRDGSSTPGQMSSEPIMGTVVNGVIKFGTNIGIQLVDMNLSDPADFAYAVTVKDAVSGRSLLGPGYSRVQWSTGTTFNFDTYVPILTAPLAIVQTGPQGPQGPPGVGAGVIRRVIPAGAINGTNTTYTISPAPEYIFAGLRNGVDNPNYTYAAGVVTWSTPLAAPNPATGDPGDTHAFLCVFAS